MRLTFSTKPPQQCAHQGARRRRRNRAGPKRSGQSLFQASQNSLLGSMLTLLVRNRARSLAGRLAGSLALAAATVGSGLLQGCRGQSRYVLHSNSLLLFYVTVSFLVVYVDAGETAERRSRYRAQQADRCAGQCSPAGIAAADPQPAKSEKPQRRPPLPRSAGALPRVFAAAKPPMSPPAARKASALGATAYSGKMPRCISTAPASINTNVTTRPAATGGSNMPAGDRPSLVFLIIAHPPAE